MKTRNKTTLRLCIYGAPGSGKGTLCKLLEQAYSIASISTGAIFRDIIRQESSLGNTVRGLIARGDFVSDEITIQIMENKLKEPTMQNGFILDGFPRTTQQATWTCDSLDLDLFISLDVDFDMIRKRLSGRRIHPGSDRVYHVLNRPPKVANKDDITGEPLIQRNDDTLEMINHRLDLYQENSPHILDLIKPKIPCFAIDASQSPEHTFALCKEPIEQILKEKNTSLS